MPLPTSDSYTPKCFGDPMVAGGDDACEDCPYANDCYITVEEGSI